MARKWYFSLLLALALTGCQSSRLLRQGDLLFHVVPESNQITDVTQGINALQIDHVAIVLNADSVVEAVGRGVKTTPLDSLRQQDGYYIIGKVRDVDRTLSAQNARLYLGRPYDWLYLPDNEAIYCSELVQLAYVDRRGQRLFEPIPMSFHDASGRITPYWHQFYERHGMEVPEGWPGTNPGELSRRQQVRIVGRLR